MNKRKYAECPVCRDGLMPLNELCCLGCYRRGYYYSDPWTTEELTDQDFDRLEDLRERRVAVEEREQKIDALRKENAKLKDGRQGLLYLAKAVSRGLVSDYPDDVSKEVRLLIADALLKMD